LPFHGGFRTGEGEWKYALISETGGDHFHIGRIVIQVSLLAQKTNFWLIRRHTSMDTPDSVTPPSSIILSRCFSKFQNEGGGKETPLNSVVRWDRKFLRDDAMNERMRKHEKETERKRRK